MRSLRRKEHRRPVLPRDFRIEELYFSRNVGRGGGGSTVRRAGRRERERERGAPVAANGGALEHAQEMAAHESPRTTKLYDRTRERLTQAEVERIRL